MLEIRPLALLRVLKKKNESLLGKVMFDEENYFQTLHTVERFRYYGGVKIYLSEGKLKIVIF